MNKKSITPFVDTLFNFLLIFICIVMLTKVSKDGQPALPPNVKYQLVMNWPGKSKTDMDLWVKDAQDHLVGFNKREGGEGSMMALSHDEVARHSNEKIEVNEEVISIRAGVEGEYVVNGHCYRKGDKEDLKVVCKLVQVKPFKEVLVKERIFKDDGDESTFFRFKLDKDGNILETNELQQKIAVLNDDSSSGPTTIMPGAPFTQ